MNENKLKELATMWVCPLNGDPQDGYEKRMVNNLIRFGHAVLEAAEHTLVPDGAKAAATLSGLYNCYVCGEEKCTEEQKLYLCKDCANGIVEEVVELIQDDRPAGNACR